ncbi:MAG: polysaccharide deacetylase family protein [Fimbriimonadaceae bacterium]|jgi:peptidoglycan/xylan/chitin deacetylase (PgdA/CDA1 family)|nr:polysaccharide deacetylase family protein [Fimbriimonadaceae bacterium]
MIPILCYHKVGPEKDEGRFLNVAPETFLSHVRFFARRGWKGIRAKDLPEQLRKPKEKVVCFSFDDSYLSAVENAAPILKEAGFAATFYAVPDLVGEKSSWDGAKARPLASWDQLLTLQDQGFEIGNHTASHPSLIQLASQEQEEEILRGQSKLAEKGFRATTFCMPYGHYNGATLQALHQAGIEVGLTLRKGIATSRDPLLQLPRVVIAFSDKVPMVIYKLFVKPKLKRPTQPVPLTP